MKGYYHSKETFGTVDGEGIRYVLFLAGCGLGCAFCHNPDTWSRGEKTIDSERVLEEVNEYRGFYETSGGGITLSGGEPLLQPEFTAEVFRICREDGISTTLDTAGYCTVEALQQVLPYTGRVLFSLKAVLPELHHRLTRADSNVQILENLRLAAAARPLTLRYVVLPGLTDTEPALEALQQQIFSLEAVDLQVELLPYHTMGVYKWQELGMQYTLGNIKEPGSKELETAKKKLRDAGIRLAYDV